MINSWLRSITKFETKKSKILKHEVLGTILNAPLEINEEDIIFGCGCYWGAEKGFWKLPGVKTTAVGYAGGDAKKPTYRQVCNGDTGHAEVVRVVWNKESIDLSDLLKLFWECHDPTQENRQGNDWGSQYRSAIYITRPHQLKIVNASKDQYQKELIINGFNSIKTEIRELDNFYFAESYHQQYLAKPFSRPYCSAMPTKVRLGIFSGCNYKLKKSIWSNYNWESNHCILNSSNNQLENL